MVREAGGSMVQRGMGRGGRMRGLWCGKGEGGGGGDGDMGGGCGA